MDPANYARWRATTLAPTRRRGDTGRRPREPVTAVSTGLDAGIAQVWHSLERPRQAIRPARSGVRRDSGERADARLIHRRVDYPAFLLRGISRGGVNLGPMPGRTQRRRCSRARTRGCSRSRPATMWETRLRTTTGMNGSRPRTSCTTSTRVHGISTQGSGSSRRTRIIADTRTRSLMISTRRRALPACSR